MAKILSPGYPLRRLTSLVRYGILAVVLLLALYTFTRSSAEISRSMPKHETSVADSKKAEPHKRPADEKLRPQMSSSGPSSSSPPDGHPIEKLVYDAQHIFAELTSKESKTVEQAAHAYRKRRGRHPPPGFDKWFEFASGNKALIVEDFFDRIYHDLEPFWGLEPAVLRKESWDYEMTINIRDGNATAGSNFFWTKIWLNMIKTVEHLLPDMDLPLNVMDEPRLVVPWADVNGYMKKAAKTVKTPKANAVIREFQHLLPPRTGDLNVKTRDKKFEGTKPYWAIARRGCSPDSQANQIGFDEWADKSPVINSTYAEPHLYKGFISNFTLSSDLCHQPDLQTLEGIFIEPLTTSATKVMFPMFGGSKLAVNNEILLPAAMYWNEEERFTGGSDHGVPWAEKTNKAVWRGVATGGMNTEHNWRGFQRHRFVAMNNGTTICRVESSKEKPENFALAENKYNLKAQNDGKLGEWVEQWTNISFTDLSCLPLCNYTSHYFKPSSPIKMAEQFHSKYLPDIDGNSFSGRYLGFLRSTSLPVKATLWREWHDSRIVPWKHFVPMDSRFVDYYSIMEYFLGYKGHNDHDQAAEKIATEGKEWAERVLRKEDMSIYVLRLLLEYGRLLDDKRERLGWVDDVLKDPSLEDSWTSQ